MSPRSIAARLTVLILAPILWATPLVAAAAAAEPASTAAASAAPAETAPALPATFFGRPQIEEARLSPSGRWVALLVPTLAGRNALAVVDPAQPQTAKVIASLSDFDIDAV